MRFVLQKPLPDSGKSSVDSGLISGWRRANQTETEYHTCTVVFSDRDVVYATRKTSAQASCKDSDSRVRSPS
jgi:hypothetical protein